ncbi:uncharacterized protein LOC144358472 [Saccoglossus kowalevskii]
MATRSVGVTPSVRVMLWAHARSRSTVFEMAIAAEPSIKVYHEQFVMAHFHGEERMCDEVYFRGPPVPGYTYQEVKDRLQTNCISEISAIFAKDSAGALGGRANYKYLPTGYINTFLIRDPKASILSAYKCALAECDRTKTSVRSAGKIAIGGGGFIPIYKLYKYVTDELKQHAIIEDSDDLVLNPRKTLQKYSAATGLPFSEKFLHWTPANTHHFPDLMKSLEFLNQFFKTAIESTGFIPPSHSQMDLSELPEELKEHIDHAMPMYNEMANNRL